MNFIQRKTMSQMIMKNLSKSEGLEQTDELQRFVIQIEEKISNFSFEKADPSSINAAIQKMESEIDNKASNYNHDASIIRLEYIYHSKNHQLVYVQ